MKKKLILIIAIIVAFVLVMSVALFCAARFVFLSPSCYSDNYNLTEQENYFIKKTVLEAVEDRLSVFYVIQTVYMIRLLPKLRLFNSMKHKTIVSIFSFG